jgi:hypothetical protein
VTQKLVCFVVLATISGQSASGTTWVWETCRRRCRSANHLRSFECHAQVVKEVKRRDEDEKIQVRELDQRSLESGQSDDPIDVGKFGKRLTRLTIGSHVHSRRSGKERRWTCNGPKLLCLLDFR